MADTQMEICPVADSDKLPNVELNSLKKFRKLYDAINRSVESVVENNPETDAADKELKGTLGKLEEEYLGILKIVQECLDEYDGSFKDRWNTSKSHLLDLKDQFNDRVITPEFKEAIRKIHSDSYDDVSQKLQLESILWKAIEKENCLDYSLHAQEKSKQALDEKKGCKDEIKGFLDYLDKLYKEASSLIEETEEKKYRTAYALTIEFEHVLDKKLKPLIEHLQNKTIESEITTDLKTWIEAAYKRFYHYKNSLIIQAKYKEAKDKYEAFPKESKEFRKRFVQEVDYLTEDDLPVSDSEQKNT